MTAAFNMAITRQSTVMVIFMLINLLLMFVEVIPQNEGVSHVITVNNCGVPRRSEPRIVGKKKDQHGKFPWMVSIHEGLSKHNCAGSILNEYWILTAAHCIVYGRVIQSSHPQHIQWYTVYVGVHKLFELNATTVQKLKLSKVFLHEYFHWYPAKNDIALLKTEEPINIAGSGGYINGICLPTSNTDPTGNAKVIGWRKTKDIDGQKTITLKAATTRIIPRETCNKTFLIHEFGEDMICAAKKEVDACQFELGEPLVKMNRGVATIVGIVTPSTMICYKDTEPGYPGLYANVAHFLPWIRETISNN